MLFSRHLTIAAAFLTALLVGAAVRAQSVWREGFETAGSPSWRDAGGDAQYRVLQHQRVRQGAHAGNGCEWLQLQANSGSYVHIAHDIGRPAVIDDLTISVWFRSDRSGPQMVARIVLPRSTDPKTGRPITAIVTGGDYAQTGRWQQLRLDGIPRLLEREVRLLRTQHGPRLDEREAYVDAVLLNVYGGAGLTNVWIDDLEVVGRVSLNQAANHLRQTEHRPNGLRTAGESLADGPALSAPPRDAAASWTPQDIVRLPPIEASQAAAPKHTVKLSGSVLLVDNRPMFPRIIQHRGEPLASLKKIGFNAVWLQRLPEPELLDEASRLNLWLICPPPAMGQAANPPEIGAQYDCVLAWDLGADLGPAELESTQRLSEQIRTADRRGNRPLVCRPRTELRRYSRSADLLVIDRRPLGTGFDLADYAAWVRRQPLLASLGTPVWTSVQTQPNESLRQQIALLDPTAPPPLAVTPEQVKLLCYTAVAAGSRGVVFTSDSPLSAADADTRQRAMTLELLNLELDLMEPWAAAGSSAAAAECSLPEVRGTVLNTDRARLLLPQWASPGAQCVPAQSATNALTLVVPGVPEASSAFELTANGVNPLRHKRVAGGVSISIDEFGLASQILLAQDPLVIAAVHHRAAQWGHRAAELQRHLAVHKLNTVETLSAQLAARSPIQQASTLLATARRTLQTCDAQLSAGNLPGAAMDAQRADRLLRIVQRAYWDAAQKGLVSLVTSPAALSFDTLPCHWRLIDRLRTARFGQDLIAGGDFEDLETMRRAGWQYYYRAAPGIQGLVDVAPQAAHSGRFGLRLGVAPVDPKNPPAAIESPPVLFTSPPVQATAGQVVCIHGWVQVPAPITASTDGLLIVDSISGECLADHIGQTNGWRPFAMYRVATQSGPVNVTFALSGLGEAWLDDVAIQVVD